MRLGRDQVKRKMFLNSVLKMPKSMHCLSIMSTTKNVACLISFHPFKARMPFRSLKQIMTIWYVLCCFDCLATRFCCLIVLCYIVFYWILYYHILCLYCYEHLQRRQYVLLDISPRLHVFQKFCFFLKGWQAYTSLILVDYAEPGLLLLPLHGS